MAMSTCIKCGGHSFEVIEKEPYKASFKVMFIQCSGCGGVVGVTEYYNIGALIHKLAKALKINL